MSIMGAHVCMYLCVCGYVHYVNMVMSSSVVYQKNL